MVFNVSSPSSLHPSVRLSTSVQLVLFPHSSIPSHLCIVVSLFFFISLSLPCPSPSLSLCPTAGTQTGEEIPIVSRSNIKEFKDSFSNEHFDFRNNPNITFFVYVSNFTWPIKIQVSFSSPWEEKYRTKFSNKKTDMNLKWSFIRCCTAWSFSVSISYCKITGCMLSWECLCCVSEVFVLRWIE